MGSSSNYNPDLRVARRVRFNDERDNDNYTPIPDRSRIRHASLAHHDSSSNLNFLPRERSGYDVPFARPNFPPFQPLAPVPQGPLSDRQDRLGFDDDEFSSAVPYSPHPAAYGDPVPRSLWGPSVKYNTLDEKTGLDPDVSGGALRDVGYGSYAHPFDIRPPNAAYDPQRPFRSSEQLEAGRDDDDVGGGPDWDGTHEESAGYRAAQLYSLLRDNEYGPVAGRDNVNPQTPSTTALGLEDDPEKSLYSRQLFVTKMTEALFAFGAPSHRISVQIEAAAESLDIHAELEELPGVSWITFGEDCPPYILKCAGGLDLGRLHETHEIYRAVTHRRMSPSDGTQALVKLLKAPPQFGLWLQLPLKFAMSALISPMAFGGSFVDMWISGIAGTSMAAMLSLIRSPFYVYVTQLGMVAVISLVARALSSISTPYQLFCYNAIASSGIITILPGFLILTAALEIAFKFMLIGSIKMIRALALTFFIGIALQFGSTVILLSVPGARENLQGLAKNAESGFSLIGAFVADNTTSLPGLPMQGKFSFRNVTENPYQAQIFKGCYRALDAPWYLQPFPPWSQFIIVPAFSTISSLASQQPWLSLDMPAMVIIACAGYAVNWFANAVIIGRPEAVSAIAAAAVGLLGNIYAKVTKRTAYTVMVPAVCFLVPSGLSDSGGITSQSDATAMGGAVIQTAIGITVGLLLPQSIIYLWCQTKSRASFSF